MSFDSRNPAPGVTVYGVPQPKVHGLSMSQAAARRRLDANLYERPVDGHRIRFHGQGVFGPHKAGGPVGLGIPSIGRTVSLERPMRTRFGCPLPTKAAGHKTPGKKGYTGRCSKAPANPIFQAKIDTHHKADDKYAAKVFGSLKAMHRSLMQYRGNNPDMERRAKYGRIRTQLVNNYPAYKARVAAMEMEHLNTLGG